MPGDLVSGGYGLNNPFRSMLAGFTNATQTNQPPRSNAEYLGFGGWTDGALAATGVGCAVPVPVDIGDWISKISIIAGATAEGTGTHSFAAIYSGGIAAPKLLAQSADQVGAAYVAASAVATWTLATAYQVQPADVVQSVSGATYIYASVAITAGTIPTAAAVSVPTATGYQLGAANPAPLFFSATHGSALAATAAATIASPAAKAVAPIVVLT